MNESTEDGELERSMILVRVVDKQPKVFQKWCDLKERFRILDWMDGKAAEPYYSIRDVMNKINEVFDNDDQEPALLA